MVVEQYFFNNWSNFAIHPQSFNTNASFTALIIGLVLVFFIKDKNESRKPLREKFYQKKVFWAWIFIPLFVILFIYSIFLKKESPYNFMILILVVDMIIFNYFGTKYKW